MRRIVIFLNKLEIREWRLVAVVSLFFCLLTTAVFLYGYFSSGTGRVFTGIPLLTAGDFNVYYSYIQQVLQGHWLFNDLFTTETQSRLLFNPFFLSFGLFAKLFGLSPVWAIFLVKLLLIPGGVLIVYLMARQFFLHWSERRVALGLLTLGSGLGFLLYGLLSTLPKYDGGLGYYALPLDLWVPEFNFFISLFHLPHQIFSFSLLLLTFYFFLQAERLAKNSYALGAGIFALILIQAHPFYAVTIFIIIPVYLLVMTCRNLTIYWAGVRRFLILSVMASPTLVYWAWWLRVDWLVVIRNFQNVLPTPIWYLTLISYGFFLPLALLGAGYVWLSKTKTKTEIFLVVWFIVGLTLLYSPFAFQRRLAEGLWFPVVILALIGYQRYLQIKVSTWLSQRREIARMLIIYTIVFIIISSNLFILAATLERLNQRREPSYLSQNLVLGYEWLKNNLAEDEAVFSGDFNGNFIPGWAGRIVYAGHGVETIWFHQEKMRQIIWFFSDNINDEKKKEFLRSNNLHYLFYDGPEKLFGDYNPDTKNYLQPVYQNPEVKIYKIKLSL